MVFRRLTNNIKFYGFFTILIIIGILYNCQQKGLGNLKFNDITPKVK